MNMAIRNVAWKVQKSFRSRGVLGTVKQALSWLNGRAKRTDSGSEFDEMYGVDTCGIIDLGGLQVDSPNWRYGCRYQAIAPEEFGEIIARLEIQHHDYIFVDIGSGKGRALLLASAFPFKKIIGVEFSIKLHQIASSNIAKYKLEDRSCQDIISLCMDATEFKIPSDPAVFYFYNPCEAPVLRAILKNIEHSLENCSLCVWLVFVNVITDELTDGLKKFNRVYHDMSEREVSIYKSLE